MKDNAESPKGYDVNGLTNPQVADQLSAAVDTVFVKDCPSIFIAALDKNGNLFTFYSVQSIPEMIGLLSMMQAKMNATAQLTNLDDANRQPN